MTGPSRRMLGRLPATILPALLIAACGRSLPPAPVIFGDQTSTTPPPRTASLPAPAPERPAIGPGAARRTITAGAGDTLYTLARRHNVSLRGLIDANRLRPPYRLSPGRRLLLPVPRRHVVAKGETVYGIARGYGIQMSELVRLNRIGPPYRISVGQTLRLPGAAPEVRVAARAAPPLPRQADATPPQAAEPARKIAAPIGEPPPRSGRRFGWPVRGRVIVAFGPRGGGLHNDGINISARDGTAVRAAENGVVAYAGNELQGFGNLLLIKHAGGWMTAYAHAGKLLVRRGQTVRRGDLIARVGRTGNVVRPQLHFEIRRGDDPVNPISYLARV